MQHFLLRLFFGSLLLASFGCEGANYCGDLVYDQVQNTCVCPAGSTPNYELDLCEFPNGEVIPWEEFDVPYRDGGPDASTDMGLIGDSGTDAGDTSTSVDAGTDMPILDVGTDATGDAGPAPTTPRPFYPWNGLSTGSLRVPLDAPVAVHPLRPQFRWAESERAEHYQIQLTRECDVTEFRRCTFSTLEQDETTTRTTYTPARALTVQTTAPVGSRYFWRVRACSAGGCSPWSEVRYLNVGRDEHDLNGDGYADIVVGARDHDGPLTGSGAVYVYYGSPAGALGGPSVNMLSPMPARHGGFGHSVDFAGDLNADGYGDLVVAGGEKVYIYLGEPAEVRLFDTIYAVGGEEGTYFGSSVAGAGDVDADGFADIAVGARGNRSDSGSAYVFYGDAIRPPSIRRQMHNPLDQADAEFGFAVTGVGDTNGDGYPDIVVAAIYQDDPEEDEGAVYIYHGGRRGPGVIPAVSIDNPENEPGAFFGASIVGADMNGDGYSDLIIGAALQDGGTAVDEGAVFVFSGGTYGIGISPTHRLANPSEQAAGFFGISVSALDFDGDGQTDLLVGAMQQSLPEEKEGAAYLFAGTETGFAVPREIDNPANQASGFFGRTTANVGDTNADGLDDFAITAWWQDAPDTQSGAVFVYSGTSELERQLGNPNHQENGEFGYAIAN